MRFFFLVLLLKSDIIFFFIYQVGVIKISCILTEIKGLEQSDESVGALSLLCLINLPMPQER